ncbi:Alpha_L_fucos domain-containing protein [Cephalotus follicularis]|uniref:alpha-L-fucosidase n=1 Tax=Cephalotus follicularis TaxID=3775 RepID=A0A1Q3BEX9_CEPFO|nr:Alpha_L_fucos domain-containing protein [Cephalotus follicularis]
MNTKNNKKTTININNNKRPLTLKSTKPISLHTATVLTVLLSLFNFPISNSTLRKPPPLPILPLPSSPQLQWQLNSMSLFLHFGPNTFTDTEWGTGQADPTLFNPTRLNASQWIHVAKEAGFNRVILTAKHHDGFCLWNTEYTDYSVRSSTWQDGKGDIVAELAMAARDAGVELGLYLSPWDRHEVSYGKTLEYNEFYMGQMTELLTRYGEIKEVFLDGAKGGGEKDMEYFFDSWFSLIHQHQPAATIFSDAGPDSRWIGDEAGVAGSTCWSLFNRSAAKIGDTEPKYSQGGDPLGHDWVPAECDVSIRPGWFWHASEVPKSAMKLLDIYYKSVGRNCHLLLNVPPNSSGLISDEDIQVLKEFKELRSSIFSYNLAEAALVNASSTRGRISSSPFDPSNVLKEGIYTYWAPEENQSQWVLYITLQQPLSFNVLQVQEPIHMGQRIIEFHLDILTEDGEWEKVINGTTVGYQRLLQFPSVESKQLRFVVDNSRADPLVSYLGIYMDHFSIASNVSDTISQTYGNGSEILQQTIHNHSQFATM